MKKKYRKLSNVNYWKLRHLQLSLDMERRQGGYLKEEQKYLDEMLYLIDKDMKRFIERYSDETGLSLEEVNKLLTPDELKTWSMTLKEFRKKAIEGGYEKELNIEYFKSRISRLKALEGQLKIYASDYANQSENRLKQALSSQYEERYYRGIYEMLDQGQVSFNFAYVDTDQLDKILMRPWKGSNFSKRVWHSNVDKLPNELISILSRSVATGTKVNYKELQERYAVAKYRARTLANTEYAHIEQQANEDSMKECGFDSYEWSAIFESATCDECGSLDGKIFKLDDKGAPKAPKHPNCRCEEIPAMEDDNYQITKMWVRNPETGKGERIDPISFDEWKKKNVAPKVKTQQKAKRNRVSDSKTYKEYKAVLGKNAPTSLDEFQKIKYNKGRDWQLTKLDYQRRLILRNNPKLKLPNAENATIDNRKFTEYLFNKDSKSGYPKGKIITERFGYGKENYKEFTKEIIKRGSIYPTLYKGNNGYGDRYEQKMIMYTSDGKPYNFIVGWFVVGKVTKLSTIMIKEVK